MYTRVQCIRVQCTQEYISLSLPGGLLFCLFCCQGPKEFPGKSFWILVATENLPFSGEGTLIISFTDWDLRFLSFFLFWKMYLKLGLFPQLNSSAGWFSRSTIPAFQCTWLVFQQHLAKQLSPGGSNHTFFNAWTESMLSHENIKIGLIMMIFSCPQHGLICKWSVAGPDPAQIPTNYEGMSKNLRLIRREDSTHPWSLKITAKI